MATARINNVHLQDGMAVPVLTPNTVLEGDGFYISYNDHDTALYGGATTALVWGQMQGFFILNGDHRDGYRPLIAQGWDACADYFRAHRDQVNARSEDIDRIAETNAKIAALLRAKGY